MATSTDVSLPKEHVAIFPDRCVACGAQSPGSHVTVWTNAVGLWVIVSLLALLFAKVVKRRIPACRSCGWKLRFRRLFSFFLFIALIGCSFMFMGDILGNMNRQLQKVIMVGAAAVFIIPWAIWNIYYPGAVCLTLEKEVLVYEFRSEEYAEDFAEMNEGEVQY